MVEKLNNRRYFRDEIVHVGHIDGLSGQSGWTD